MKKQIKMKKGRIILLTGISGSGKTTLGCALQKLLRGKFHRPVEFIDGDIARKFLESGLGYSESERFLITKQIAFGAYLLARNGIDVVVANIAGKSYIRSYLRKKWKKYILVFLDADIRDCIAHDPKGIYKRALTLKKPQIVGYDIPYEKPHKPDVTVFPYKEDIRQSLKKIEIFLSGAKKKKT